MVTDKYHNHFREPRSINPAESGCTGNAYKLLAINVKDNKIPETEIIFPNLG